MTKRTQLNINIDEALLKQLKTCALSEDLALSVFIRNSLRKIVSSKREDFPNKKSSFLQNNYYLLGPGDKLNIKFIDIKL